MKAIDSVIPYLRRSFLKSYCNVSSVPRGVVTFHAFKYFILFRLVKNVKNGFSVFLQYIALWSETTERELGGFRVKKQLLLCAKKNFCLIMQLEFLKGFFLKLFLKRKNVQKQSAGSVLYEKVFLEILQNSQENTCARVPF